MSREQMIAALKDFFARSFQNYDLASDQDIFALGFVNSLFAMQLVEFVEVEFGITLETEDLELDNFRTLDAIAALALSKTGASRAA
jgi:acyl carrier protein